ncbi:MAG: glycosyltransferase [Bacteroidia bacterium]|nr:glycosyltransferase [Bacteroidia bacterium]
MIWLTLLLLCCLLVYAEFVGQSARAFGRLRCGSLPAEPLPFVSLIIPARNEAARIEACLQSALGQDYPADRYEVILVNDHSEDHTAEIARRIAATAPNLRVLDLTAVVNASKKAALTQAIAVARGEIILQTDADCTAGPAWVRTMAGQFGQMTGMVSGPVLVTTGAAWLERLQSLELAGLVALGAGAIARNRPNLCNGANLAYRKAVFEEVGGFAGATRVASGDDEFLLQKIHALRRYEIRFAKCPEAIVQTPALPDWPSLKAQRLRWVSKARSYLNRRVNMIQLVSYLGFWTFPVLGALAWTGSGYGWLLALAIGAKLVADYGLMTKACMFLRKKFDWPEWLLLELVYIPYVLWIGLAGNLVKDYVWKGRRVE